MQPLSAGRALPQERETSYGFIYSEVLPPDEPFQSSVLKTWESLWPFWISDLQVFFPGCGCEVCIARAAQHIRPLASVPRSLLGGHGACGGCGGELER